MTFGQPLWFWAFAIFPIFAAVFLQNERRREKLVRKLVAARLQDRLAGNVSVGKRRARFLLLLLGLAGVILSLTQPRYGYAWQESKRRGRDVLLAIDVSRSMLATDLAPNRLARAKLTAQDLIRQLEGDRVGLVAFAGSAFLQAPLTADYGAVLNSMNELDPDIIPVGGSNMAEAIKTAEEAFGKGESDHRCLIIFTDGEELDADGIRAAERVKGAIRIFTVGLGSADGSLIPVPGPRGGSEFVKDPDGQFVKSKLDETRLRKIAEATGGFYVHLLNGPAEMTQIIRDGLGKMSEQDIDAKLARQPIERYQWPLSAALVLLASSMLLGERKRVRRVAALAAALVFAWPSLAQAKNEGVSAYESEDFKGAMERFEQQLKRVPESEALHFNLGAAAYKAGEYDKAMEAFARAVTSPDPRLRAKAEYNLANTLYQRGAAQKEKEPKIKEWQGALQHYDEALKVDPKNGDAAFNRDLVRKMIEQLQQEPPKSDEQKKEEEKKEQDKKDQKDKEQKQDGKPQDSKDGESKEDESKDGQGEPKDQKGDKKEQPKDGEKKDGQKGEEQQAKNGDKPEPKEEPKPGDKKKEGEMKEAPQFDKAEGDAQQQAEADALAAAEGKMTPQQAKALLDSLKGEDERVQMRERKELRGNERVFRNW